MEGLIPYIYRAIKRRRARKYYRSLSTGASQWFAMPNTHKYLRPPPIELGRFGEDHHRHHRRHRSLEDFSGEPFSPKRPPGGRLAKEMMSGSSRMFACITGAT